MEQKQIVSAVKQEEENEDFSQEEAEADDAFYEDKI
jgi:hypothetical protein